MRRFAVLLMFILFWGNLFAQEALEKEEVKLEGSATEKKVQGKDKKVSVFEIVNRLLVVEVRVEGKRLNKKERAEMAGRIESSIKDCIANALMQKEEYQKRDNRLFDSDSHLKVRVKDGTFVNIKILESKTKSPFIKECLSSLKDFEVGYNIDTELNIKIKTRIK